MKKPRSAAQQKHADRFRDPDFKALHCWQKGQAGNPSGVVAKTQRTRLLKQWLREGIQLDIPIGYYDALLKQGRLDVGKDSLIGAAIATRILERALQGDDRAIEQILATEPRELELTADVFIADEALLADRLDALAERNRTASVGRRANGHGAEDA